MRINQKFEVNNSARRFGVRAYLRVLLRRLAGEEGGVGVRHGGGGLLLPVGAGTGVPGLHGDEGGGRVHHGLGEPGVGGLR